LNFTVCILFLAKAKAKSKAAQLNMNNIYIYMRDKRKEERGIIGSVFELVRNRARTQSIEYKVRYICIGDYFRCFSVVSIRCFFTLIFF
jgi:hypothetical protein